MLIVYIFSTFIVMGSDCLWLAYYYTVNFLKKSNINLYKKSKIIKILFKSIEVNIFFKVIFFTKVHFSMFNYFLIK